ncbi:hypothetical protein B0H10DRAFT_1942069 [Mycena sp. CBHHK59/15]|nr:hypothetical protein B0H10DRAFT_1942069 [Mycena sp. CBHHK59/15]
MYPHAAVGLVVIQRATHDLHSVGPLLPSIMFQKLNSVVTVTQVSPWLCAAFWKSPRGFHIFATLTSLCSPLEAFAQSLDSLQIEKMSTVNMPEPTPGPLPFTPQFPFDDPDADVILRSADNHDFRVYCLVLSLASPFFNAMFTLRQPDIHSEFPVIPMQESGLVLDRTLRFWYPSAEPTVETLDQLREVLLAAKESLKLPLRIPNYNASLKLPLCIPNYNAPMELNYITGATYHALLQYHHECGEHVESITSNLRWLTDINWPWFNCKDCGGSWKLRCETATNTLVYPSPWFTDYLASMGKILAPTPSANINDLKFMSETMEKIAACNTCRSKVFTRLPDFVSGLLIPKIQEKVAKVCYVEHLERRVVLISNCSKVELKLKL